MNLHDYNCCCSECVEKRKPKMEKFMEGLDAPPNRTQLAGPIDDAYWLRYFAAAALQANLGCLTDMVIKFGCTLTQEQTDELKKSTIGSSVEQAVALLNAIKKHEART